MRSFRRHFGKPRRAGQGPRRGVAPEGWYYSLRSLLHELDEGREVPATPEARETLRQNLRQALAALGLVNVPAAATTLVAPSTSLRSLLHELDEGREVPATPEAREMLRQNLRQALPALDPHGLADVLDAVALDRGGGPAGGERA